MQFDKHTNLVQSKLVSVPADKLNGQTFSVYPGDGQKFYANQPVTMWPDGQAATDDNAEIGYITAINGDALTVLRAQEGSLNLAVQPGWNVAATLTKRNIEAIETAVNAKIDQVAGKGLSTNDYTTSEKTKLAGIAPGATQNASDASLRDRSTHTGSQAISTVTGLQSALDGKQAALGFTPENTSNRGAANGYASLDGTSKVPAAQLPSYVDDVLEYSTSSAFPVTGEAGKIYVALDSNRVYRWTGSTYVEISPSPGSTDAVPEGSSNLYYTSARASSAAPVQSVAGRTGAITLAKSDVGLGSVDNTSDANKPVSTAQQTAIAQLDARFAPLASPAFTGTPTAPTATAGTNTTQLATTAFVSTAVSSGTVADATTTSKGVVQLAGDLGGTAASPQVLNGQTIYNNFIVNPSFETDLSGWTTYGGGTKSRATTFSQSGSASYQIDSSGTATDGGLSQQISLPAGTFTFSFYARMTSDVTRQNAVVRNNGVTGTTQRFLAYPGNTNFNQYTLTFTNPTAGTVEFLLGLGYSGTSVGVVQIDAVQLELSSTATAYFDGNTAGSAGVTYMWTGATNNSASYRTTKTQMTSTNSLPEGNVNLYATPARTLAAINGATITPGTINTTNLNYNAWPKAAISNVTGAVTLNNGYGEIINATAASAAYTITLPTTAVAGYKVSVKKTDNTAFAITLKAGTSGTIDGANTYPLSTQYKYVNLLSTGTNDVWWIYGNN